MKDVEEYMIDIVLLGSLAIIDFKKKEIHILILLPVIAIWLGISVWNKRKLLMPLLKSEFYDCKY